MRPMALPAHRVVWVLPDGWPGSADSMARTARTPCHVGSGGRTFRFGADGTAKTTPLTVPLGFGRTDDPYIYVCVCLYYIYRAVHYGF